MPSHANPRTVTAITASTLVPARSGADSKISNLSDLRTINGTDRREIQMSLIFPAQAHYPPQNHGHLSSLSSHARYADL